MRERNALAINGLAMVVVVIALFVVTAAFWRSGAPVPTMA